MAEQRKIEGTDVETFDGQVAKPGALSEAAIARLLMTTAGAVFGEKTKTREGETLEQAKARPTLVVYFEGTGFAGNVPINVSPAALANPKSTMGKFVAQYGAPPRKGMKVSVRLNADGFHELVI